MNVHPTTIYLVTEHFGPSIGGLESSAAYLASALAESRPVEILTADSARAPAGRADDDGPVRVRRFVAQVGNPYKSIGNYLRLSSTKGETIVFWGFSHRWTGGHLRLVTLAKRELGLRVIFRVSCVSDFSYYATTNRRMSELLLADYFACLNPEIRMELERAGIPPDRLVEVANGVPLYRFVPPTLGRRRLRRQEFGFYDDQLVFVYTGRFAKRKRLHVLIEAFSRCRGVVLALVGYTDNRYHNGEIVAVPKGAAVRVFNATHDVVPYLHASDAFVSASSAEGMPNSLLEAMSCGLPALVSAIPAHRQVLPDAAGWFFEPDNVSVLVERLVWLRAHRETLRPAGGAAREAVQSCFSIQSVASTYLRLVDARR